MRSLSKLVLAMGLVVLSISPAQAQGQGRGGFGMGGGGGAAGLLSNKGVQEEIKATSSQAEKLDSFAQNLREKQREQFQKLQDLSQEDRREKMQELTRNANAEVRKGVADILKPEQVKRFEQIQLQQAGVAAFATPRVQEDLKLTDDQKAKVRQINEDLAASVREAMQGGQSDRAAAMQKVTELRKQGLEKVTAMLSDDQKSSWKELIGSPYEVKFERRPNNNN